MLDRKMFLEYNDRIVKMFEEHLTEEHVDVFNIYDLKGMLRKNNLDDTYLEYSLTFLERLGKVQRFSVQTEGDDLLCVKFLKDSKSSVTIKDTATINLVLSIKKIDRNLTELEKKMNETLVKVKECLLKKDRKQAHNLLKKKEIFKQSYEHYFNVKLSLEQNLLDIKSMESNQNIRDVLKEASKATQKLKLNVGEFENITDQIRDDVDNLKEVQDIFAQNNNEVLDNEDLEKELNDLLISEEKSKKEKKPILEEEKQYQKEVGVSRIFPNAKEDIILEKENKENFINNNSFEAILEEINKK